MNFYDQYPPGSLVWIRNSDHDARPQIGFVVRKATNEDRLRYAVHYGSFVVVLVGEQLDVYGPGWIFPLDAFPLKEYD